MKLTSIFPAKSTLSTISRRAAFVFLAVVVTLASTLAPSAAP